MPKRNQERKKEPKHTKSIVKCRKDQTPFAAARSSQSGYPAPAICFFLPPSVVNALRLSGREGLGDNALERQLLLLQVISRSILNLELSHGVAESRLNLLLLATLEADSGHGVGDHLLNTGDVRLELLPRLELLAEGLVAGLELGGIADHVLNVGRRELTNGVGDGDVGATTRGLLGGGDLEDTVDVDLEDNLKNGITSLHGWDRSKGEFTERCVVLTVDTLTLVNGELNCFIC